jgi:hypothetical protein
MVKSGIVVLTERENWCWWIVVWMLQPAVRALVDKREKRKLTYREWEWDTNGWLERTVSTFHSLLLDRIRVFSLKKNLRKKMKIFLGDTNW